MAYTLAQRARDALGLLFNGKGRRELKNYFKMLDGYVPIFRSFDGGLYEMELTRSCVHAFATHVSKLQPHVEGPDLRGLTRVLNGKPNPFMTSAQFLYKCATIFEVKNTLVILPILDSYDRTVGYYPAYYTKLEIFEALGEPWLRVTFENNDTVAYELRRVGIVSKYLYKSDLLGESNAALDPTMQLLAMQAQGIMEGIKNSASFRFMASAANFAKAGDLKKERQRFVEENFGPDSGGLALFPNTYTNVKQIMSSPKVVDSEQMRLVQDRVYTYFGTNEEILHNKAAGDAWSAYYEGKIEPFALQLSQALTMMSYSDPELARGNAIMFSANRLQYMTNADKLQVSSQLFDRGILSTNMIMDIWQLPRVPDGDARYIRKEYIEITQLDEVARLQAELAEAKASALPGPITEEEEEAENDPE